MARAPSAEYFQRVKFEAKFNERIHIPGSGVTTLKGVNDM